MRKKYSLKPGFTIVEMIVIIAIIGILAAVTLVAYNGYQQDAKQTALLADLDTAASVLELDLQTSGQYPTSVLLADNGDGLPTGSGTTYQYTVDTSTTTPSYCLTGTNGTSSYKITSSTTTASVGGCPGHGVGGVAAITNLIVNPSFESNVTGWAAYVGVSAPARVTTTPWSGVARLAAAGNNTALNPRVWYSLPVTTGDTISVTVRERSDGQVPNTMLFVIKTRLGGTENGIPIMLTPAWAPDANGWMTVSATYTVPVNVDNLMIQPGLQMASNFIGTLGVDAVIAVNSSVPANYADGSSPNWVWSGTVGNSTSFGPAL